MRMSLAALVVAQPGQSGAEPASPTGRAEGEAENAARIGWLQANSWSCGIGITVSGSSFFTVMRRTKAAPGLILPIDQCGM